MAYQQLAARVRSLELRNATLERVLDEKVRPLPEDLSPNQKGYIAEQLVKYLALRQGYKVYDPPRQDPGCDLLIKVGDVHHRVEVKATAIRGRPIYAKSQKYVSGSQRSRTAYSSETTDFIILVDLTTEEVWIVPQEELQESSAVTISEASTFRRYKDNWTFSYIKPEGYENKFRPDMLSA